MLSRCTRAKEFDTKGLVPPFDLREVAGMNAFFIIPTGVKSAFGEIFMTHPPLEKRLARLAAIAQEMGRPVS